MSYDVLLHPAAARFLRKAEKELSFRIKAKLALLREGPFTYLEHLEGKDYYKMRVGDYRALIDVDVDRKIVFVRVIDHRKRIYKSN